MIFDASDIFENVDNIWNILNDEKTILESIEMIFQFDKIYDDDT